MAENNYDDKPVDWVLYYSNLLYISKLLLYNSG